MNRKITRALAALLAGLGVFAFAGCKTESKKTDNGPDTEINNPDTNTPGGGTQTPGGGDGSWDNTNTPGGSGGNTGNQGGNTGGNVEVPDPPVIPTVPAGSVKITEAAGDLEAAYVKWDKVEGAMGYNVYCKNEADGDFVKLDAPLVREYKDYCRADAVGLKAGKYTLKVVPTGGADLKEDNDKEATATGITVLAHERTGYAFVKGTSSGAYNEDGTLKSNANVVYVTEANKNTVSLEVTGAEANPCVGIVEILKGYSKLKETRPLDVRLIGNVTDPANIDSDKDCKGDLVISNANSEKTKIGGPVTFEGIGSDATANGWGLRVKNASNVEIRNLGFMNCNSDEGDNIGLQQGNDHVWVHNCDLFYGDAGSDADQVKGDGALDTKKSSYVTHSYNHFWDSGKCNLQGMKDEETTNCITYHHNWYDHSDSRHPRIRTCTVHIYNNYFDGNAKYGVGVTMGASAFVENNYFRSTVTMKPMLSSMQGTDAKGEGTFSGENGGIIKAYGNTFDGKYSLVTQNDTTDKTDIDCYLATSRNENVSSEYKTKQGSTEYSNFDTKADFYEYEVDTAEVAKEKVELYAGRIGGGDMQWNFNDATEDGNYTVIPQLKAVLTGYKSDLIKVGGTAAGGTTSGGSTSGGTTGGDSGDSGNTGSNTPVDGEVTFIPTTSGSGFTVSGSPKSHAAIEVAGVSISKNSALKLNSSGSVTFETTKVMTLNLYLLNKNSIKVDGVSKTPVAEGDYFVVTLSINAGSHTVAYDGSENSLYLIKLIPQTA